MAPKTENPPTVAQLRRSGYKVACVHKRRQEIKYIPTQIQIAGGKPLFQEIKVLAPRGGTTIINLRTPDGIEYSVNSYCDRSDCYNRKFGIKNALMKLEPSVFNQVKSI